MIILLGLAIIGGFVVLVLLWRMRERYYTRTGYRGRIYARGRGIPAEDDAGKIGPILDRPDDDQRSA